MVVIEEFDNNELARLSETVMRQTDYDREKAEGKLVEFDMNVEAVIRDYLKPPPKEPEKPKSRNQQIYKEIRSFMDVVPQTLVSKPGK